MMTSNCPFYCPELTAFSPAYHWIAAFISSQWLNDFFPVGSLAFLQLLSLIEH